MPIRLVVNATTITATAPAGSAGTASVLVATPGGANAANTLFTYVTPAPTVTITGTNPTGATAVTSVMVVNATTTRKGINPTSGTTVGATAATSVAEIYPGAQSSV
jgi:hypothetical protein